MSLQPRDAACIGPRQTKDPRSVEYAWQTLAHLKFCYQSAQISHERWLAILAEAEQHSIYARVPPESPYGSLDAMLLAEIGVDATQATAIKKTACELAESDEACPPLGQPGNPSGRNQHSDPVEESLRRKDSSTPSLKGNQAEYIIGRIKRDADDETAPNREQASEALDKLRSGEFRSARQAGIHAGIVRVPTPLDLLRKAWRKASAAEKDAFMTEVNEAGW